MTPMFSFSLSSEPLCIQLMGLNCAVSYRERISSEVKTSLFAFQISVTRIDEIAVTSSVGLYPFGAIEAIAQAFPAQILFNFLTSVLLSITICDWYDILLFKTSSDITFSFSKISIIYYTHPL